MEIQRLVVEDGNNSLAVDFHPRLTVLVDENPVIRSGVIAELIDALGPARPGVHVELTDSESRRLAVFRPSGGRHRVVDIERSEDLSALYLAPGDRVDILGRAGLDPAAWARLGHIGANHLDRGLDTGTDNHRWARTLAAVDQDEFWAAADRLSKAHDRLASAQEAAGGADAAAGAAFESAAAAHERTLAARSVHAKILKLGLGVALASGAAGGGAWFVDPWTGKGLLGLAAVALVVTLLHGRHAARAAKAERAVLAAVGQHDYEIYASLSGRLADAGARGELLAVAAEVDEADARWRAVAGDIPAEWAQSNRDPIERLAARRADGAGRRELEGLEELEGTLGETARLLIDRLVVLRTQGITRERLPLVLDEPFSGMTAAERAKMLEVVSRLAMGHQVILATGDRAIAEWASRLGEDAGAIARVQFNVPAASA
ncbi:MAG: hypothetical protein ACKVWR_06150 [Acidimicrobiales bacterium]